MPIRDTEVEVRAFVSPGEFRRLKDFFNKKAKFINRHRDQTLYFDKDGRLRLRREKNCDYLIYKFGKIHDPGRRELELKLEKKDLSKLKEIFEALGFPLIVYWNRERMKWSWRGLEICLDNTEGYGRIFEMEAIVAGKDKKKAYNNILGIFKELGVKPTPELEMRGRYNYYIKNWRKSVKIK